MVDASFLTVAKGADRPIAVWTDDLSVLAYHTEDSLPDFLAGLPRWRFRVPVTQVARTSVNATKHPVLDCNHRPLWQGCAIEAQLGSLYIYRREEATFVAVEETGGCRIQTRRPIPTYRYDMRIRSDIRVEDSTDQYFSYTTYDRDGPYPSVIRMIREIGNYDIGFSTRYLRLTDDPRTVCTRARRPRRRAPPA